MGGTMGAALRNRAGDELFVWAEQRAEPVLQRAMRLVIKGLRDRCEECWKRFRNTFFVLSSFGFSAACIAESLQFSSTEGRIVAWMLSGVFILLPFSLVYQPRVANA
jgi:hypothetical protein